MNDILIEQEVQKRVAFKMSEFWDAFNNYMKRNEHYKWASIHKDDIQRAAHFLEAYEEIKGILKKEIELPTALDGEMKKRLWEEKEKLVNKLSNRLLNQGTRDYIPNKKFINNCIEEFIN